MAETPTELLRCPTHGQTDCSALLNGCSVPNALDRAYQAGLAASRRPGGITVAEAAEHIGVSVMTVYRLLDDGAIPYHQVGRSKRINRADWDAYVASTRVEASRG